MKRLYKFLTLVLCVVMLQGCGVAKLSSDFSEEKLKLQSEEIIKNFANEKYEEVVAKLQPDLREKLKADKLKEVGDNTKKNLGKFDSITKRSFAEKDKQAIVISSAKYEKGQAIFTLSFNKDMELTGFYIK